MSTATLHYASTGSNTAASGSNAPTTAVTGTAASGTGAATTINLGGTFDLTGVADDDTDLIWCATTTGERHLFRITSFTGGVAACTAVVVANAIGATTFSGANWAIGGKRLSFENDTSLCDYEDIDGWNVVLGDGETYTTTKEIDVANLAGAASDGPTRWTTEAGYTTRATISSTASINMFNGTLSAQDQNLTFKDLLVSGTGGSTKGFRFQGTGGCYVLENVDIDTSWESIIVLGSDTTVNIYDCDITGAYRPVSFGAGYCYGTMKRCVVRDTSSASSPAAIDIEAVRYSHITLDQVVVKNCHGHAIKVNAGGGGVVDMGYISIYNTIAGASGARDGIAVTGSTDGAHVRAENVLMDTVDNGVSDSESDSGDRVVFDTIAIWNSNAKTSNATLRNEVTVTASPFVDAPGDDFSATGEVNDGAKRLTT